MAVDVRQDNAKKIIPGKIPNIFETFYRLIQISESLWIKNLGPAANIILKPKMDVGRFQYHLAEKAIMAGEESVLLSIPKIKRAIGLS